MKTSITYRTEGVEIQASEDCIHDFKQHVHSLELHAQNCIVMEPTFQGKLR